MRSRLANNADSVVKESPCTFEVYTDVFVTIVTLGTRDLTLYAIRCPCMMPPGNVRDDEVKEGLCTFEVYDNGRLIMRFIVLHQK